MNYDLTAFGLLNNSFRNWIWSIRLFEFSISLLNIINKSSLARFIYLNNRLLINLTAILNILAHNSNWWISIIIIIEIIKSIFRSVETLTFNNRRMISRTWMYSKYLLKSSFINRGSLFDTMRIFQRTSLLIKIFLTAINIFK